MPVDEQGNEIPETEVVATEPAVETQEAPTFTQEQLDEIIQQRIAEVRNQSAQELQAYQQNIQAQLEGYRQAVERGRSQQQQQSDPYQGIEDDPEPPYMTQNQKIMWDAGRPQRLAMKRQVAELERKVASSLKPLQADGTATEFFNELSFRAGGKQIPEALKTKTINIYRDALRNPDLAGADPRGLVEAAWNRALALQQEEAIFGVGSTAGAPRQNGQAVQGRPAPKIATPASADISGGTRIPGTGRIGKKETTWQEDMQYLIDNNLFPEDMLK